MKKQIALLLALLLAFGCFTGCSKDAPTEEVATQTEETTVTEETAEQTEGSAEPQTLTVYTALTEGTPEYDAYMAQVAAFEEASGAVVTVNHYGENLPLVLDSAIESGAVDVFSVENISELQMRASDVLDLTAYAEGYDTAFPVLTEQIKARTGILCGLPIEPDVTAMWYNTASFRQAGVKTAPTSGKEFAEVCEKLTEAGFRPIALDSAYVHSNFGIHMERALGADALTALVQSGGWADSKDAVAAVQEIIDMVYAGWFDENAPVDWPFSQLGLADRTVMIYADMATLDIAEEMIGADIDWGCFAYPGRSKTVLADCSALCINADTLAPDLAWNFLCHMAENTEVDAEVAQILSDAEGICDVAAIVKAGPDLTEVIKGIYAGTYADGAEAAAALDTLY